MRILAADQDLVFIAQPYADGVGASLYVGVADLDSDPGPTSIVHRRNRSLDGAGDVLAFPRVEFDLGASSIPKTPRIAAVDSPDAEFTLSIPEAWHGKAVWLQVRTFADDLENETLYRPRRLQFDDDGDIETTVRGSATILSLEKRDGGGLVVRFAYRPSREGAQPVSFLLRKLTGMGTIATGSVDYQPANRAGEQPQRSYEAEVTGLTNAAAYTFELVAITGSAEAVLVSPIAFTGDSAGPPAVSGLIAVEV